MSDGRCESRKLPPTVYIIRSAGLVLIQYEICAAEILKFFSRRTFVFPVIRQSYVFRNLEDKGFRITNLSAQFSRKALNEGILHKIVNIARIRTKPPNMPANCGFML